MVTKTTNGRWVRTGVTAGNYDVSTSQVTVKTVDSKTVSGSRTAGFHNPNRSPILAPLPYEFDWSVAESEQGTVITRSDPSKKWNEVGYVNYREDGVFPTYTNFWQNSGSEFGKTYLGGTALSDMDAQARNALLSKIKGQQVNMAVATAEAHKTMSMVGNAAMNIYSCFQNLRRGDFVSAAGNLGVTARRRAKSRFTKAWAKNKSQALASGWLELQYGWKPLLDDVHGAVTELNDIGPNQGLILHSAVNKSRVVPLRYMRSDGDSSTKLTKLVQIGKTDVRVRYGVTYSRMLGARQDLPRLGITNPALVAWELVPYSFVVDWFLPVGQFLGNLDATLGVQFRNGYRTHFRKSEVVQIKNMSNKWYPYLGGLSSSERRVVMSRVVLTDFPSIALPRFKNPASLLHMTNALALLTNLFKK